MKVLDAGALIAIDRGDRDTWALMAEDQRSNQRPALPAPVVAEAWRGSARQARLAAVLSGCDLVPTDSPLSRRAGELVASADTTDVLDALVALVARDRPGCEVLTSAPDDIHHLLESLTSNGESGWCDNLTGAVPGAFGFTNGRDRQRGRIGQVFIVRIERRCGRRVRRRPQGRSRPVAP